MKCRYRVRFVGSDKKKHHMIVWAENGRLAKEEAKRRGAVFVMSVKPFSLAWLWIILGIGLFAVLLAYV